MKVSSFKQFLEEEDSKAIVQTGINSKSIDNNVTKEIINSRLATVTSHEFLTPYIALGSISRVLAYANIIVPQYTFLDRHEGEVVFDATQFGKMSGVNTDGTKVDADSGHFVYFSYVMNDDGHYDCFAALVDQDELDDILDIEGEDEEDVDKIGVEQKVDEENSFNKKKSKLNEFKVDSRFLPSPQQSVDNWLKQFKPSHTPPARPSTPAPSTAPATPKLTPTPAPAIAKPPTPAPSTVPAPAAPATTTPSIASRLGTIAKFAARRFPLLSVLVPTQEIARDEDILAQSKKARDDAEEKIRTLPRPKEFDEPQAPVVHPLIQPSTGVGKAVSTIDSTETKPVIEPKTQTPSKTQTQIDLDGRPPTSTNTKQQTKKPEEKKRPKFSFELPGGHVEPKNYLGVAAERGPWMEILKQQGHLQAPDPTQISRPSVVQRYSRDPMGQITNSYDPSLKEKVELEEGPIRIGPKLRPGEDPAKALIALTRRIPDKKSSDENKKSQDPTAHTTRIGEENSVEEGLTKYWNKYKKRNWLRSKGYKTSATDPTSVKNTIALAVRNARDMMKKEEATEIKKK